MRYNTIDQQAAPGVIAAQLDSKQITNLTGDLSTVHYLSLTLLLIPLVIALVLLRRWSVRRRHAAHERTNNSTTNRRARPTSVPRPPDQTLELSRPTHEVVEGLVAQEFAGDSDKKAEDNIAARPTSVSAGEVSTNTDLNVDYESIPIVEIIDTPDDVMANSVLDSYKSFSNQRSFASPAVPVHGSEQESAFTTEPKPGAQLLLASLNRVQDEKPFDFWGITSRRKWLVFLGLATGLGLGGLYNAWAEVIYESLSNVRIEPQTPIVLQVGKQGKSMVPDSDQFDFRHDRTIAQYSTIERCLNQNNLFALDSLKYLSKDDAVKEVLENLTILPDKDDIFIYKFVYRSTSPVDSQIVLNSLIESYKSELNEQYEVEADKFISLLKEVKNQFENSYRQIQDRIKILHDQNTAPNITSGGQNIHEFMLIRLSQQIEQLRNELTMASKDKQRCLDALESGEEAIAETIWIMGHSHKLATVQNSVRELIRQDYEMSEKIAQAEIALSEARQRLGTSHPTVRLLREQAETWKNHRQESAASVTTTGEESPEVMLRRLVVAFEQKIEDLEGSLQQTVDEFQMHQEEAERLAKLHIQLMESERERDYIEEMLSTAKNKIVEIDPVGSLAVRNTREVFRFRRLMDAQYGEQVWPILWVSLGTGGLLGWLVGFGLGCLMEFSNKTFQNSAEIINHLNLPLIGHIPVIGRNKRSLVGNSSVDPIICTYHRPKSQASEAFSAVRTALYFNTKGIPNSVIQVTGPTPGDGKSTVAANLAVSIARSGKRCLLVDGDMRRPCQGIMFGIKSHEGLSTTLTGQSRWQDVVFACKEIEGLSVMPCGPKPDNPAELCTSPQLKDLIEELRDEYDFVVIDTPPLLAVTDPCPIAVRVDGVILTIRSRKNVKISAERATDMLRNLDVNIVGVVANGVSPQSGYGSSYSYGAFQTGYADIGYGYGYGDRNGAKDHDDRQPKRSSRKQKQEIEPPSGELMPRRPEHVPHRGVSQNELTQSNEIRAHRESRQRTHEADRSLAIELLEARDQLKNLDKEASRLRVALAELEKTNEQLLKRLKEDSNSQ